eukprot:bmy_17045T0
MVTERFFIREDGAYEFNPDFLEKTHEWNQKRARKAMRNGIPPIITDITAITTDDANLQGNTNERIFSGCKWTW